MSRTTLAALLALAALTSTAQAQFGFSINNARGNGFSMSFGGGDHAVRPVNHQVATSDWRPAPSRFDRPVGGDPSTWGPSRPRPGFGGSKGVVVRYEERTRLVTKPKLVFDHAGRPTRVFEQVEVTEQVPVYQRIGGARRTVDGRTVFVGPVTPGGPAQPRGRYEVNRTGKSSIDSQGNSVMVETITYSDGSQETKTTYQGSRGGRGTDTTVSYGSPLAP